MIQKKQQETMWHFKLVRDRIPEILAKEGKPYAVRKLQGQDLKRAVGLKLLEETHELFRAWHRETPEIILREAADLLEITLRLLELQGFALNDLLRMREEKRRLRGGFEQNIFLDYVGPPPPVPVHEDLPRVFFIPVDHATLIELIRALLLQSTSVSIASAFYTPAVTNLLLNDLDRFAARGGNLRILLSTMGNLNRPEHLQHIKDFVPRAQVRVFHPPEVPLEDDPPAFHAKAYLFERDSQRGSLIVGSSNFTQGGFFSNIEWNYFSSNEVNLPFDGSQSPFERVKIEFDRIWDELSVELTEEFLIEYRKKHRSTPPIDLLAKEQAPFESKSKKRISPNAAQREALDRLKALREEGAQKAAVVAATGVGKTYLAAFDFQKSGLKRLLFIAHRENILHQARRTFEHVFCQKGFGTIIGGGNRVDRIPDVAFAMIQTLSRPEHLERFPRDHFEYIVIDEFHHAAAESYARVLRHFRPQFLLGLTATPERADGRDVLQLCGYNIAYEVRLLEAVDRGWLTPFQYYAIYDPTDYEQITWRGTHYDERELEEALSTDTRTQIVAHNLYKYLPSSGKIKALAFCSSVAHARYTARQLSEHHEIPAAFLVGEHSIEERQSLMKQLQDENDPLNVICCVDVFNEGIDIPNLSHILLLRPTQSFTLFLQQIGRGLRRAPGKDFTVILDFVGNYRKAHVAPLALMGYTSLPEAIEELRRAPHSIASPTLPSGCFLDANLEVKRIWDEEIREILQTIPLRERLKAWYLEIMEDLGVDNPQLMDFMGSSSRGDPKVFLSEFGCWIRAKLYCQGTLPDYERSLLDTPGEAFLRHIETELHPTRSYKMAVLKVILRLPGTRWSVDEIAKGFRDFYLQNREMLFDYDELARAPVPDEFPISKVRSHLLDMPLKYLSNTERDWFILDTDKKTFRLKEEMVAFWKQKAFRDLVEDRVEFELTCYFQRRRLRQTVHYQVSLSEWGFELEPFFVENLFYRKRKGIELRDPLAPGEKRKIELTYRKKSYRIEVVRPDGAKHFRLDYSKVPELLQTIKERFQPPPRKGQKVFILMKRGSQGLHLIDVQG